MGINSFYKTLSILFGESFIITKDELNNTRRNNSIKPEDVYDNIYFDFNTLLYKSTHGSRKIMNRMKYHQNVMNQGKESILEQDSTTEKDNGTKIEGEDEEIPQDTRMVFHSVVLEGVMRYLNHFDARESLFFSVDGPAPRSKLITQKVRRYLNSAMTNTGNTFVSFINLSDMDEEIVLTEVQKIYLKLIQKNVINERNEKKAISSVWFVPGTNLMQEVSLVIWQLGALVLTNPTFNNNLAFYHSPAGREGEGEFKILEHIYSSEKNNHKKEEKRDLIVSGDSDFVLYALNLPRNRHITLVKDMPGFYQLYDVTKLKEQIARRCRTKSDEDLSRIITDMTFLFILCGNDYISKPRRFDIKLFMDRYIAHQKYSENREYLIHYDLKQPSEMKINVKFLSSLYSDYIKDFKQGENEDTETSNSKKKAEMENGFPKINIDNIPTKEAMVFLITLLNLGKREFLCEEYEIIDAEPKPHFQVVVKIGESYITTARGKSKKDAFNNAFKNIFLNFDYGELHREAKVKTGLFETREQFNEFLSFFYQEQIEKYANSIRKLQQKIAEVSYQPIVKDYLVMCAWFMSYIQGKNLGYSQYYKPKSIPSIDELVLYCEKEVEGKPDSFLTINVPASDNFILNPLEFCVSSCVSAK
ncbi:predicted protein [Naegleria gruberi]|uniref:Predicted protein n=1 Tax=Naegleria gruberi TaxID=5762 RepID=D2W0C3_NAEGR|nr:uncharacterized protein NAEGRDRAFT_53690 [Naegleria gruberi]EFC37448.1 predicted protein [Naegleria gruberi]|eukprot:XP_002670192.1 predicted protein [Naegleria gruberi strain NEG-M]